MRRCHICGRDVEPDAWHAQMHRCQDCYRAYYREYMRAWREQNPDAVRGYRRKERDRDRR